MSVKMEPSKLCDLEDDTNYKEISKYFVSSFGTCPNFFTRVPGRVNLIGEHIDYCGFFVMPMAIEQDIIMAVRINNTNTINLVNFDSETYKKVSLSFRDFNFNASPPEWYHYFLCGYWGVLKDHTLINKGLDVVVKGTIPPASGLSSSSALVCASALATCYANKICKTRMQFASLCAISEQFIGTQGGGMDQAIGFLAETGAAKLIEFNPLKATTVPLPEDIVFVVCNSGVAMNKAATSQFNTRVMECRLAAKVLAKIHGFNWKEVEKLAEIPILLEKDISEMKAIVKKSFPEPSISRKEICSLLEISDAELSLILSLNTQHLDHFQLKNRAIHVFEEATRVREFKLICEDKKDVDLLRLGILMNKSHASCSDLYECSHPILDELVFTATENAGALGSRLTGAGWGGCCISMVLKNKVQEFMTTMKEDFYNKRAKEINIDSAMFVTKPSSGAAIFV